jgi:hypothetical protein
LTLITVAAAAGWAELMIYGLDICPIFSKVNIGTFSLSRLIITNSELIVLSLIFNGATISLLLYTFKTIISGDVLVTR